MKYLLAICLIALCPFHLHANTNITWNAIGISEFMATNETTIQDVDGDYSPWIELYNPTTNDINLAGWSLTVDTNNLSEWIIPGVTLEAGDYIVIFASGKNRTNNIAELHTNFRPPVSGGFLGLVNPSHVIQSFFNYPAQTPDVSYGADPATPNLLNAFPVPTPDDPNSLGGFNAAADVVYSQTGGTFLNSFSLQLSSAANTSIYYTTNGDFPNEESFLYQTPITIGNTVQIRARAFSPGLTPRAIHSETFIQLDPALAGTNSNLPAIVLYNFAGGPVPTNTDQLINFSLYEPQNGVTSLTNAPTITSRGAIHLHGFTTLSYAKKSLALDFWDELNSDTDYSPLGLPAESDFILYACDIFEPVLTHNPLIYQLSNDAGRYASRTRYVEVYLNLTGGALVASNYNGIYVLEEKIVSLSMSHPGSITTS